MGTVKPSNGATDCMAFAPQFPTPYNMYITQIEDRLKIFASNYDPKGPPHSHHSELTRQRSRELTQYIENNWSASFANVNYPLHLRKVFPPVASLGGDH